MHKKKALRITIPAESIVKSYHSFFDKRNISRIFYFHKGLSKKSQKSIPIWMQTNIRFLFKGENEYLKNHFNPSAISSRVASLNNNYIWKDVINIRGGYAATDVLLHTIEEHGFEKNIIERIYYGKRHTLRKKSFYKTISLYKLKIKHAQSLGVKKDKKLTFYFNEYIENGAHPNSEDFLNFWYEKSLLHLWENSIHSADIQKNSHKQLFENSIKKINELISKFPTTTGREGSEIFINHSDLNPTNIIIFNGNDFKVIDWAGWTFLNVGMGYKINILSQKLNIQNPEVIYDYARNLRLKITEGKKPKESLFLYNFFIYFLYELKINKYIKNKKTIRKNIIEYLFSKKIFSPEEFKKTY